jgi:hypothetical protein
MMLRIVLTVVRHFTPSDKSKDLWRTSVLGTIAEAENPISRYSVSASGSLEDARL